MARLHEYMGKKLLAEAGLAVPSGRLIAAGELFHLEAFPHYPAILKAQAWTTSRMAQGLIRFVDDADAALAAAEDLFGRVINNFTIDHLLLEQRLAIKEEYFLSYFIDDATASPQIIFATTGGSGVEDILRRAPDKMQRMSIDLRRFYVHQLRDLLGRAGISGKPLLLLGDALYKAVRAAIRHEARSLEINPLVLTEAGTVVAADCRMTIDDYAVFRHPEVEVEIARELANPPTALDRIAYAVEKNDYRGTFYFIQMESDFTGEDNYVGFHGAGGGGSMMSMDAIQQAGFKIANFCDTSGNPPASKVYRAARIIAAQPNICGYFGSGSGVASQEQVHSARGLVKAFREMHMPLPVVVRLGGNLEDEAVAILESYTADLPAPIRGFKKDDPVSACAAVFAELAASPPAGNPDFSAPQPAWLMADNVYRFTTLTGEVYFNHDVCRTCKNQVCISACIPQILKQENGVPVLAISPQEAAKGKCIECLICEVECQALAAGGGYVDLPIAGLADYSREGK
jgi:succinyl-CoA synthetase beta subunit